MKQLSLDVLRSFVTIVDVGNFNKAGKILGRSQPAISLQIKKLESQVNKKLFAKIGQSYQVNADGQWLYAQATKILAMNDDVFRHFSHETLRGSLRLGIPSEFASVLLPSIIGQFSQRYPDVSLDVTSALSKNLLSNNQSIKFDLILALVPDLEQLHKADSNLAIEHIRLDELVWAGDPARSIPNESLDLVLAPNGCVYRSRVIEQLKQQTQAWKITYTNPDFYGLMAAIKEGLGITALARSMVPEELTILKDKRLPNLGTVNICLLNQDTQHPQISQALAKYLKARLKS